MKNRDGGSDLTTLLLGLGIGAVLGLLYAPEKGELTRNKLKHRLDEYLEELRALMKNLKEVDARDIQNSSKKVINDMVSRADVLMEEMEKVKSNIGNNKSND